MAAAAEWPVGIAWCFHISAADLGLTFDDEYDEYQDAKGTLLAEEDIAALLTVAVRKQKMPIKRGDLISLNLQDERYRNTDVFIYDGKKVIELDCDIDEYGAVPPCFEVTDTEFSPQYWRSKIAHNSIFWLAQPILDRMQVHWDSELRLHIGSTKIGRAAYTFIVAPPNDEELTDALDGKPVTPSETAEQIMADLRAGKYYFELNHGDLECVDLDVQVDRLFYAIRKPVDEDEKEKKEAEEEEEAEEAEEEEQLADAAAEDEEAAALAAARAAAKAAAAKSKAKDNTKSLFNDEGLTVGDLFDFLTRVIKKHGRDMKVRHEEFGGVTVTGYADVTTVGISDELCLIFSA